MLPKIDRFLATAELHPVLSKASQIKDLARLCSDYLPPELAPLVQAANLRNGSLVLLAANSAAAAKLKLLSPGLGTFLLKQGCEVNAVSVRVQPNPILAKTIIKQSVISSSGLHSLEQLASQLGDSPLRAALETLLRHQRAPAADATTAEPTQARSAAPGEEAPAPTGRGIART